jgi:hypothetical protein
MYCLFWPALISLADEGIHNSNKLRDHIHPGDKLPVTTWDTAKLP